MTAPLSGIRVLEVANWLAAPAAGALFVDLGADVIKVEPPGGDVLREFLLRSMGYTHDFATNYAFQLCNRGKRSVTVALDKPGGPELVRRLAAGSDVFLTNGGRAHLRRARRARCGRRGAGEARGGRGDLTQDPLASCQFQEPWSHVEPGAWAGGAPTRGDRSPAASRARRSTHL